MDDHSVVRRGIAALIAPEPDLEICAEAASCAEAREILSRLIPDVLIVDVTLKDGNGLDLLADLRARAPGAAALVLTMHDETLFAERALSQGAAGYVMKDDADHCLVEAIRTVRAGRPYISPEVAARMQRAPQGGVPGISGLTPREREVFEWIGRGWTTRRIAEQLALSERTVEVHRAHIKQKMGCAHAAELVRSAVRWVESSGAGGKRPSRTAGPDA
ncbi:MAG: response regulator transcription factor [Kiritimatiellia bacterium]|nr:response regulator transcription factor [Kiritimatiellia bacterium]